MKLFFGKVFLMVMLVVVLVGVSSVQVVEIKIGVVLFLSGVFSGYGQLLQKGLDIIQVIILMLKNGDIIKFIVIDDKSDKVEVVNVMQCLVFSDKVDVVIGEVIFFNILVMIKIVDDSKMLLVFFIVINDCVICNYFYVSWVCFLDSFQGVVGVNLVFCDLKVKIVVIVFDSSNDYFVGLVKVFCIQFLKNGGIIFIEVQVLGGSKDFKVQLVSVKVKNVDMIYMLIYYIEGVLIVVQFKQLGFNKLVVGGDGLVVDQVFFDVGKDVVNGYMIIDYYLLNVKEQILVGEIFIKVWEVKYQQLIYIWGVMVVDVYNVIVNVMNQCSDFYDWVCVNEKICVIKDFQGVIGMLMLQNGDVICSVVINEVKDGKLVFCIVVNF